MTCRSPRFAPAPGVPEFFRSPPEKAWAINQDEIERDWRHIQTEKHLLTKIDWLTAAREFGK